MTTAEHEEDLALVEELNASFKDGFPYSKGYETVLVLLICWEDGEPGITEETQQLLSFFNEIWGFSVTTVLIPSERSQASLQNTLSNLIITCSKSKGCLLLLHYGGYGDANPEELKAIWAA